jgi:hypothetical protein
MLSTSILRFRGSVMSATHVGIVFLGLGGHHARTQALVQPGAQPSDYGAAMSHEDEGLYPDVFVVTQTSTELWREDGGNRTIFKPLVRNLF